jgi:hypothetical protein
VPEEILIVLLTSYHVRVTLFPSDETPDIKLAYELDTPAKSTALLSKANCKVIVPTLTKLLTLTGTETVSPILAAETVPMVMVVLCPNAIEAKNSRRQMPEISFFIICIPFNCTKYEF